LKKTYLSALAALSIFLVLSAASAAPLAPDYTKVGVKLGDTADYRTSFTVTTWNRTHILVYGIVGTVITLNYTFYDPSGTVGSSGQMVGDIYNGAGSIVDYLIAADLTALNPIYVGAAEAINDTSQMTVAGALRTINHIDYYGGFFEAYWDQATGLMTELHLMTFVGWMNHTLLSTTAWSAPSLLNMTTIALVEGIVIIVLLIALIVVASRRRRG